MAVKSLVERKKIADLMPDPSNANAGTERGLSMLDDSLSVSGLGRSIVTDKHGVIIAGNKTTERAMDRGFENAVVVHTRGDELVVVQRDDLDLSSDEPNNPARRLAYYDNRVAQVDLTWNAEQLLADVNAGFDFIHLFSDGELDDLLAGISPPLEDEKYSRKIEAPTYTPSDKKPAINELYNDTRTKQLIAEIDALEELSAEQRLFLTIAAQRHTVLNFARIADYYAHGGAALQRLMENSALVIIDFNRAIELGYVLLTERIAALVKDEYDE